MIYPRLLLARNLLREDRVIFVSIDDNEIDNLKKICNEIFMETNFVGTLILQTATDNNPRQINTEHEYMVCYANNKSALSFWQIENEKAKLIQKEYLCLKESFGTNTIEIQKQLRAWISENEKQLEGVAHYDNVDEKGVFHDGDIANTVFGEYCYAIIHPITNKPCKIPDKGFRFAESTMLQMIKNGDIMFGKDETTLIKPKKRIENAKDTLRSIIYEDGRTSTRKFEQLMNRDIFQNPKSDTILMRLIKFIANENDIVLDLFSGSATTAESVITINANSQLNLKFIMIQLQENLDKSFTHVDSRVKKTLRNVIAFLDSIGKSHTICEIGKERIRRAGNKIREKAGLNGQALNIGFRVFKTADSNMKDVYCGAGEYN
jgi:adenine-specific DNA-methyltransferase